jgi:hypothetical protein
MDQFSAPTAINAAEHQVWYRFFDENSKIAEEHFSFAVKWPTQTSGVPEKSFPGANPE